MDLLFKIRSRIVICFLLLWASAVSAKLFYYTVTARDKYLEMGDRLAWKEGVIPAARGRILDRNHKVLAWTEKYFDLFLFDSGPAGQRKENEVLRELSEIFVFEPRKDSADRMLLKKNLSPEEILLLDTLTARYPELKVVPRNERRYIDYSFIRSVLGSVSSGEGPARGVSGLEHKYDGLLSGSDGIYVVMLDKQGNWIRGTWKLLRKPAAGKDIVLEKSIMELRGDAK